MNPLIVFITILLGFCTHPEAKENTKGNQKLIVMRHGQSEHNALKICNSDPFHPAYIPSNLTHQGKKEIEKTAEKLLSEGYTKETIDLVVVSPLPRTMQTAMILVEKGLVAQEKIVIDSRLIDRKKGNFEGVSYAKKGSRSKDHEYDPETTEDVRKRIRTLYLDILRRNPKGHVLVVTHRCTSLQLMKLIHPHEEAKLQTAETRVLPLIQITSKNKGFFE